MREEERLRAEARRRQRDEEERLVRERERLKKERQRLEREKADLLRLERERQKLEREKIELERLELKRQQLKYAQQSITIILFSSIIESNEYEHFNDIVSLQSSDFLSYGKTTKKIDRKKKLILFESFVDSLSHVSCE